PSVYLTLSLHDALPIYSNSPEIRQRRLATVVSTGVTFEEASTTFWRSALDHIPDPDHSVDELRFVLIGFPQSTLLISKGDWDVLDRKSTRLNSSHQIIS